MSTLVYPLEKDSLIFSMENAASSFWFCFILFWYWENEPYLYEVFHRVWRLKEGGV